MSQYFFNKYKGALDRVTLKCVYKVLYFFNKKNYLIETKRLYWKKILDIGKQSNSSEISLFYLYLIKIL